MRLLLDTHVLLWALDESPLSAEAQRLIESTSTTVCVSAASAWEIGIKKALGKLRCPDDLEEQLRLARFVPLPVTIAHGLEVGALPALHGDPFDRLLVAQARTERMTLVTRDERLADYGIPVVAA